MSLIVMKPLTERRHLKDADPSGETWIDIRQARQHEELIYAERTAPVRVFRDDGATVLEGGMTIPQIRALECWLTFSNSNIAYQAREDGKAKPLFVPEMRGDFEAFMKAFGLLPPKVALEWQHEVWWVNPDWASADHPSQRAGDPDDDESEGPSGNT